MRFLIYIGGADNGFWTAFGGEARYVTNIAQALQYYGHIVDCVGGGGGGPTSSPTWGVQEPILNINFVNEHSVNPNIEYDAYINAPWELRDASSTIVRCKQFNVKTKLFIHIMWSWNKGIEASISPCWEGAHNGTKHIVAYPYDSPEEYVADKAPLRCIPNPVYCEYPHVDPSSRRTIAWVNKGVFSDDWPEDKVFHEEGAKLLKAMAVVSNKHNAHCHFILTHKDFAGERANRFGVPKIVDNIKNKTVHQGFVLKNELDAIFSKSRISVRPPHYSGSFLDSFPLGAVPLFYSGNSGGPLAALFSESLRVFNLEMPQKEMEQVLERVFVDDEYYISLVKSSQEDMKMYSYENCYKHILSILKEFV